MAEAKNIELAAMTRRNLIEAFWLLYSDKKIENISVKDITDKAGYHRSTFYRYFIDIYDLLEQVEKELLDALEAQTDKRMVDERRVETHRVVASIYETKGQYFSLLLSKDSSFAQKMKDRLRPYMFESLQMNQENTKDAYLIEMGMSAIISAVTYWYRRGKDVSPEELVDLISDSLTNGVLMPLGDCIHED